MENQENKIDKEINLFSNNTSKLHLGIIYVSQQIPKSIQKELDEKNEKSIETTIPSILDYSHILSYNDTILVKGKETK